MMPNTQMPKQASNTSVTNRAMRSRRTVPVNDEIDGDKSIAEESLRSSGSPNLSSSSHHRRRRRTKSSSSSSSSSSSHKRAPRRRDSTGSHHSRGSISSVPSITIDELKKSITAPSSGRSLSTGNIKTPSNSSRLTIGSSSILNSARPSLPLTNQNASQAQLSSLPDLFSIEQALNDLGEEELTEGIQKLMMQHAEETQTEEEELRRDSITKTPVAWKTPFEVDAPRLAIPRSPSPSEHRKKPDHDPTLSEEQDAWAGIDELLECKSMNDSFAFSTSEILPKATVKAMRRDYSLGFLEEEPQDWDSQHPSSHSNSESAEADARLGKLMSIVRRKAQQSRNSMESAEAGGGAVDGGNLFDMFHWSEKDNVDELRAKTKKLNRKPRKVQLLTNSMHSNSHHSGGPKSSLKKKSSQVSDTCSLPSLADYTVDESTSDWESVVSSVVSESSRGEFGEEDHDVGGGVRFAPSTESVGGKSSSSSLGDDGLVLDIRKHRLQRLQIKSLLRFGRCFGKLFVLSHESVNFTLDL